MPADMLIGVLALFMAAAALLWAAFGAIWPSSLFIALPEKRTRLHAVCFPLLLALTLLILTMACTPEVGWGAWLAFALSAFGLWRYSATISGARARAKAKADVRTFQSLKVYSTNPNKLEPYSVNLVDCTCTCPDWATRRAGAPQHTPFRLCKHLISQFREHEAAFETPVWLKPYSEIMLGRMLAGKGMPIWCEEGTETAHHKGDAYILTVCPEEHPWANLCVGFKRFGFNLETGRWAKGEHPAEAEWYAARAVALAGGGLGAALEESPA